MNEKIIKNNYKNRDLRKGVFRSLRLSAKVSRQAGQPAAGVSCLLFQTILKRRKEV
jgi:hypothetical protein